MSVPSSKSSLLQVVQFVCDDTGGGRASQCDRWIRVIDCPVWTARATAMLRVHKPTALVAVETSVASLSGFIILISEPPPPMHRMPRLLMLLVTLLCVLLGQSVLAHMSAPSPDSACADAMAPNASQTCTLSLIRRWVWGNN